MLAKDFDPVEYIRVMDLNYDLDEGFEQWQCIKPQDRILIEWYKDIGRQEVIDLALDLLLECRKRNIMLSREEVEYNNYLGDLILALEEAKLNNGDVSFIPFFRSAPVLFLEPVCEFIGMLQAKVYGS